MNRSASQFFRLLPARPSLRCVATLLVLSAFVFDSLSLFKLLANKTVFCNQTVTTNKNRSCCSKKKKIVTTGCGCSAARQTNGTCCCAKKKGSSTSGCCNKTKRNKSTQPFIHCPCGSNNTTIVNSHGQPRLLNRPVVFFEEIGQLEYLCLLTNSTNNPLFAPDPPPPRNVI